MLRVLVGLSIRTGIGMHDLERYSVPRIRQYVAMLDEINQPSKSTPSASMPAGQQTPEQMMAALTSALGHMKR